MDGTVAVTARHVCPQGIATKRLQALSERGRYGKDKVGRAAQVSVPSEGIPPVLVELVRNDQIGTQLTQNSRGFFNHGRLLARAGQTIDHRTELHISELAMALHPITHHYGPADIGSIPLYAEPVEALVVLGIECLQCR